MRAVLNAFGSLALRLFGTRQPAGSAASTALDLARSELRRLELALEQSEARYRALFEDNGALQWLVDPETQTIVDANPAVASFYGYPPESLRGMPVDHISAAPQSGMGAIGERISAGHGRGIVVPHRLVSGEVREMKLFATPVDVGGRWLHHTIAFDVTARLQAENERQARHRATEEAHRFRTLAEAIPQIVFTAQPDGWLDYYNAQWFTYTGTSLEQAQGLGWDRVVHPDDLDLCVERWRDAVATGETFEVEYRFRRASDGAYRWHLGRARPHRDEFGEIVKWFGTCTDIHDQKQALEATRRAAAKEARHDSARRFREIVEAVRLAAVELDVTGQVTFVNDAMLSLTGYRRNELVGADWFATCAARPEEARRLFDDGVASDSLPAHFEGEIVTKVGAVRVVQWDNATHYDERGRVCGSASFGTDVTDRRAEEAALTLLLEVTRAVGEAPMLADALTLTLERLCSTTGWSYGEVWFPAREGTRLERLGVHLGREGLEPLTAAGGCVSMDMGRGLPGRAWQQQTSVWAPNLSAEPDFDRPEQARAAGVNSGAAIPVLYGDTVVAVLCFFMEFPRPSDERRLALVAVVAHQLGALIARRRAEQEIVLARDAAEAASRAKSDFLARMSHELRTPLNSIIGFADLLVRSPAIAGRAQDAKLLERVRANGRHLLGLINDVLDLAKVESGHLTIERSFVRLDDLVREVASGLAFRTVDRDVSLRYVVPDIVAPYHTDETRLRQVLLNLVGNALKFTERGEVTITIETDPWTSAPRRVIVRDTGIGIAADRHQAVFEAFEQADVTVTRRFGGTGLGLPIARALCEALGFRLMLESAEGAGSTFVIELDAAQAIRAA
jgi:PAS domain S-box-containing protein